MSSSKPYMGTKPAPFADTTKSDLTLNFGIYKGLVKKIDTETRNGRLYVYVDEFGGNDATNPNNWVPVNYASPFGGVTPGPPINSQYPVDKNTFSRTQQSYGFFMTPPDVGNIVLCCFPQGQTIEGYWFACINPNLSRYMTPAIGGVPYDMISDESKQEISGLGALLRSGTSPDGRDVLYPVGEFNANDPTVYTSDWAKKLRPLHIPQTLQLINQGLDQDPARGSISSSMQRDTISGVFGVSTPGRPIASQDPARTPDLRQKLLSGTFDPTTAVTTRVGGHSIVMDDGDFYGNTNLMRFKTASGHQIMMNDSDGFIYISNANGNSWVELTNTGDVLIYARRDLAIRTEGNLMMHSDRDILINAERNFNVYAGSRINLEAQLVQTNAKVTLNLYGKQTQLKGESSLSVVSTGSMSIKSGGKMAINGATIALNGGGGGGSASAPTSLGQFRLPDAVYSQSVWQILPDSIQSIAYKVPTHEPYLRSGNVAALLSQQTQQAQQGGTAVQYQIGKSQADKRPAANTAPKSSFISQPQPSGGLCYLDRNQTEAYMAQIGFSESNGNYLAVNQFWYAGKYQMGAAALETVGLLKQGASKLKQSNKDIVTNSDNWVGGGGPANLEEFLNNKELQEQVMYAYTKSNCAALVNLKLIDANTPPDVIAGLLAASHLVGPGGPPNPKSDKEVVRQYGSGVFRWWVYGVETVDGNSTAAATYYNRGKWSVQPEQVKIIADKYASTPASTGTNP